MPSTPVRLIVPLRKSLFQPLHNSGKFSSFLRFYVKLKPVFPKKQSANLEIKLKGGLIQHGFKYSYCVGAAEQRFPVVDAGTDFVPYVLF
jgi:hypothetical protein